MTAMAAPTTVAMLKSLARRGSKRSRFKAVPDELALAAQRGERSAMEELSRRLTGLVRWLSLGYSALGLDKEDFVQEGWLGFMRALQTWRPGRGTAFNVWMTFWVRAYAAKLARHRLSRRERSKGTMFERPDEKDWEEDLHEAISYRQVKRLMRIVPPRDALIVEMRAADRTLQDVGEVLGVSRERVRQIELDAPRRIRAIARRGMDV